MPIREKNDKPLKQSYGAASAQERFQQATRPPAAPPGPSGAPGQAHPGFGEADLQAALFAATDRPDEPVIAGAAEVNQQNLEGLQDWFPILSDIADRPDASPALRDLATRMRTHFGRA